MRVWPLFLSVLTDVAAMDYCRVEALTSTISEPSSYKFTVIQNFQSGVTSIKAGDVVQTQFPAEVTITDTLVASECYRIDSFGGNVPLASCAIAGTVVSFPLDVTMDTGQTPLVYVVGMAKNPPAVITTSSFQVSIVSGGSTVDSYTSGLVATYSAGTLKSLSISSSTYTVYTAATVTVTFKPQHDIPTGAQVVIYFPPPDFEVGSLASLMVKGMIGLTTYVTLTPQLLDASTVAATGLFPTSGLTAAADTQVTVTVYPVNTPDSMRTSSSVSMYTANSDGFEIDASVDSLTVTPTAPRTLTNMIVSPAPTTVLTSSTYSITISPDISFPKSGKLQITIPSTIAVGTVSCTFTAGFTLDVKTVAGKCAASGQVITTSGVYYVKSGSNLFLNLQVAGLTNPPDTVQSATFQFSTHDASGNLMCQNTAGPKVTATVNAIKSVSATRASSKVSAAGPYLLSFSTSTKIPQNAKLKLVLPTDQVVASPTILCYQVSGGTTLTTNICSGSVSTSSSAYTITLTEYCSTDSSGCPAGTSFSLSFSGVANLPYVKTITSSVEIYTYNVGMTGGIDQKITGITFTPSLVTETITDAAISRVGDVVGQNAVMRFSFTPPITLVTGAKVVVTFPQEALYPDDSAALLAVAAVDSTYSNPTSLVYSALTQYSDTSYNVLTISTACASACVASTKLYFTLSSFDNKPMVKTLGTAYSISVTTTEGYGIAAGTLTATGVGVLVTGTITAITLTRSSNSIQTAVSIELAFVHQTIMSATSEVDITFPDKLLMEGTGLSCSRKSDSAALVCAKTTYASGAINTLVITSYCASTCSKNTAIDIVFAGLKTLDSIAAITGAVSIVTKDSTYLIDQGSLADITTQVAPLVAGTLINVSILQDNPTTGVSTSYRVIFTPSHSIPAGAIVTIAFPAEVTASDRTAAAGACSSYFVLDSGLQCSITSKLLTVTGGFPAAKTGSWMVGLKVASIGNSATAGTSSNFVISTTASDGSVIDSGTGTASFYSPLGTCASECATCAGADSTCYSCANPGASPLQSGFSCLQTCPSTTFLVSSPTPLSCVTCHYTCGSCTSSLSSACLTCAGGLYKSNRSCVSSCPGGTTVSGGNCVNSSPCTSPCVTCSTSPTFCLSCDSASAGPVLNSKDGTCVATQTTTVHYCPDGYYQSSLQCQPCSYSCSKCFNSATYCTECKTIYGTPYLNKVDNTCVSTCPAGVTVLVGTNCEKCDSSCATCNGTSSTSCLTCPAAGTKYKTTLNQCVATCPVSTFHYDNADGTFACIANCDTTNRLYIDSAARYCKSCYATCLTCTAGDYNNCLTCDSTTQFIYFSVTNECLTVCPSDQYTFTVTTPYRCYVSCPNSYYNFINASSQKVCVATCASTHYFVDATNTCTPCASSCLTCTGVQQNSCSSCDLAGTTPYLTYTNYCVNQCPPDLYVYEIAGNKKCLATCPSTDSYNYVDPNTGTLLCKSSCGAGFWVDAPNNYCKPCFSACKTCSGGTAFQCVSCNQSGTYPYLTYQNECVTSCPSNLYINGYTCLQTCPGGTYNFDDVGNVKKCVTSCTGAYWIDTPNNYCRPCDTSCATCSGGTAFTCTTCTTTGSNQFLTYDGQCVVSCPLTMFIYTLSGEKKCLSTCPANTYYFKNADTSVSCVSSCATSSKYFINSNTQYCSPCDSSCLTCKDSTNVGCLSCDNTLFFTADSQCLATCPVTQYEYTAQKKCVTTCTTPLYNFVDSGGKLVCTGTCDAGNKYFIDTATNTCSPCYQSCLTCSSGKNTSCITCDPAYPLLTDDGQCVTSCPTTMYLYNGKCLTNCPGGTYFYVDQVGTRKCVTTCDSGFYLDVPNRFCYQCFSTCLTCSGINVNNCVTCQPSNPWLSDSNVCLTDCGSLYSDTANKRCYTSCPPPLYNSVSGTTKTCISVCPAYHFVDASNNCLACDSSCYTCKSTSSTGCLSCDSSGATPYLTDTGMCVATCPLAVYRYEIAGAKKCFTTCPAGTSLNYDNPGGYKECIATCGGGFYVDSANNYCRPCYSTCLTCGGTTYTDCLSCNTSPYPYLTSDGQCVASCPGSMFTLEVQKRCYTNCPTGYYNFINASSQKVCTDTCGPTAYFIDSPNNYCRPCYTTCLTCKDVTYQGCLTCSATLPFWTDTGECVTQCPATMFRFTLNSEQKCYTNCPSPYFNYDNPLGYKECISTCGDYFFVQSTPNKYCIACNSSCKTCSDTTATSCLSCNQVGATPYFTDTKQCVAQCQDPYPYKFVFAGLDLRCYGNCPTDYYNSYNTGTSLKECVNDCGTGFFVDTGNNCTPCASTCKACSGTTTSDCTSCADPGPTPYLTDTHQCLVQCLAAMFVDTTTTAKLCYTNCPLPKLNFDNLSSSRKECISTCPALHYTDTSSVSYTYCRPCASSCKTCNGTTATDCLSCDTSGSTPYYTETHTCVNQCPATMYRYTLNGEMSCYTVCPESYNYVDPVSLKNVCKATCDVTAQFYVDGNFCKPCSSACLTCSGPAASNCLSCLQTGSTPYLTDTSTCVSQCSDPSPYKFIFTGFPLRCYSDCPTGYYNYNNLSTSTKECIAPCGALHFVPTGTNDCLPCDSTCKTCNGLAANNCLSCDTAGPNPLITDEFYCVATCPTNMYKSSTDMRCYVVCPTPTLFYDNPATSAKECITTCPSQHFIDVTYCRPCSTNCQTCSGTTATSCLTCISAAPLLTATNECAATCPTAQYLYASVQRCYIECPRPAYNFIDPNTSQKLCSTTCGAKFFVQVGTTSDSCLQCFSTCSSCDGTAATDCLTCDTSGPTPFLTDAGECVAQCPSTLYTYTLNGEKRCYSTCPGTSFNFLNPLTSSKECLAQCVTAVYFDSLSGMCQQCYSTCKSCDGTTSADCVTCDATGLSPYFTTLSQCLADCPPTVYKYTVNGAMNCFDTCPGGSFNFDNPGGYKECIVSCGAGHFIQLPNTCQLCFVNCLSCKDSTSTGCLTCDVSGLTPFLSYTGECLALCPATDYRYDLAGVKRCMASCPLGSYGYNNPGGYLECISTCGPGYYLDTGTSKCTLCHVTCATCGGTSSTSCITCSPTGSYPFLSETGECVTSCGALYQYTFNGEKRCYSACPLNTFMYTTPSGIKQCVDNCGPGFYLDTTNKVCYDCESTCATCSGTTNANCVTCKTNGAFPYLTESNTCVAQCDPQYQYTLNGSMMCYAICPGGSYGLTEPGGLKECVSACGVGYYFDPADNTCTLCYYTCLNCQGLDSKSCTSCLVTGSYPYLTDTNECVSACGGLYMFKQSTSWRCLTTCPPPTMYFDYLTGEKECVTTCSGNGFFIDTPASYCRRCDSTCLTCSGTLSSQCITCDTSGTYKFFSAPGSCVSQCPLTQFRYTLNSEFLCYATCPGSFNYDNPATGKECITACPPGTYLDAPNNYCKPCNGSCLTCFGTLATDCLSCDKAGLTGFYTDTHECVSVCPATLYIYNPNGEKRCVTSCPTGSFNYNNIIGYKECLLTCGPGNYISVNDCLPCFHTCKTCNGGAATNCVTCDKSGSTPYITEDLQCVQTCPATTYIYSPNGEMMCVSTCPNPYYNADNPAGYKECLAKCANGFYIDTASDYCRACFPSCLTCNGGTSLSCTSCDSNGTYRYATDDGGCVIQCPSQYYYFTVGTTIRCVSACPTGTFKYNNPLGYKECVGSCPAKTYIDLTAGACVSCYPNCLTCSGALNTECTTCDLTSTFPYISADGQCLSVCSSTQYVYVENGKTTCYSICPANTYQLELGGKQCVDTCPPTTYALGASCVACDKSCATCTGTGNYSCSQCNVGYISYTGKCVSTCPTGYKEYYGTCVPVCNQSSCKTCDAAAVFTCQECVPGYILYNSQCYDLCPDGTYRELSSCQKCSQKCNTCKGPLANDCVTCPVGMYMYMGGCVDTCPAALKPINGRCQVPVPCELPCTTCVENTADICTACVASSPYLVSSKCYEKCPNAFYPAENSKCLPCPQSCGTCSGPLTVNCLTCPLSSSVTFYLNPTGTCATTCPEKYFANNDTHVCQSVNYFPVPLPANITLPEAESPNISNLQYRKAQVYPVATAAGAAATFALLTAISKFTATATHITEANLLALFSAVDMSSRAGLVVALWRYGDISPAPFEIAVSAGLVMGSVCLSMMFLVLYMDPVMESSAAMDSLTGSHKWGVKVVRMLSYVFGLHFLRILYGGLFGLSLFSHFKSLGNSSSFRLPLEKLSSIHLIALLIPQVLLNTTILLFYEVDSDPFQLAAVGVAVDLVIAGVYLVDYYRGPWRS